MEYRRYVRWCEGNHLPPMDYEEWECGYFMRGIQMHREQRNMEQTGMEKKRDERGARECGQRY